MEGNKMKASMVVNRIDVIGEIWEPGLLCSQSRNLTRQDVDAIREPLTRGNIARWIDAHFGDFRRVIDFRVHIGEFTSDWDDEDSDIIFSDCSLSGEEENLFFALAIEGA